MKKLNENISRNILNKLNESYQDNVDIVESTIAKNGEDYGVKSVEGKDNKILVKTNNGSYWFVVVGDKIKISMQKDSAEPVVRTTRGKMSVPKTSWEVSGVFKNPVQAAIDALETLEPSTEDEFVVLIGDSYLGGFDENDEAFMVSSPYTAQKYSTREEAENIASQFENGKVEEI